MAPRDMPIRFVLENMEGSIELVGKPIELQPAALAQGSLFIILDPSAMSGMKTKVNIGVYAGDRLLEEVATTFVGPINTNTP